MLFQDIVQDVVFWVLSVAAIGAALGVVLVRDLFRAVLLLAGVFIAMAGFFVLLSAEFLAVVQVLIYVGAISILFIFAIMLTRNVRQGNLPNRLQIPAVLFSTLLLAALVVVATSTEWNLIPDGAKTGVDLVQTQSVNVLSPEALEVLERAGALSDEERLQAEKAGLADLLIGPFVLPFEAVSVLLLAALIGGLALARPPGRA
ncbi:MAG: NADH-quinone oxidoreductase subunit J [Chloroflexi bacterium]|nr:NADH-quinone oxidoreductase subunit J [Chloroflexota bacterium]